MIPPPSVTETGLFLRILCANISDGIGSIQGLNVLLLRRIRGYKAPVAAHSVVFASLPVMFRLAGTKNRSVNPAVDGKLINFSKRLREFTWAGGDGVLMGVAACSLRWVTT